MADGNHGDQSAYLRVRLFFKRLGIFLAGAAALLTIAANQSWYGFGFAIGTAIMVYAITVLVGWVISALFPHN